MGQAMAVKTTDVKSTAKLADDKAPAETKSKAPGQCVVDDGTPHMGRAVNGVVCSAHAMHYDAAGKKRGA